MPKEYRSRNRIVLDVLRAVAREPGVGRTRLLAAANLSTDRLNGYLAELLERGLVARLDEAERAGFQLTVEGRRFLGELERVETLMADFGMGL